MRLKVARIRAYGPTGTISQQNAIETKPIRFVFVLLDNFTLLSFASALDCLRLANRNTETPRYEWLLIGEGGDTVSCSTQTEFKLDDDLVELHRDDRVILCGGIEIQAATTKRLCHGCGARPAKASRSEACARRPM